MKQALAQQYAAFAYDMITYLNMKLDGYRRVDMLPENHAMIQTAIAHIATAEKLLSQTSDKDKETAHLPASLRKL